MLKQKYTYHSLKGIDIWSVGCIAAELLRRSALLPGASDLDQLSKIFDVFGTPTQENWPNHNLLPDYCEFRFCPGIPLRDIFTAAGNDLIELLQGMFLLNPAKRLDAAQCLRKFVAYFTNYYSELRTALFFQRSSTNASAGAATSSKMQSRTRESAQIGTNWQTQAGRRDRLENRQTPVFLSSTKEDILLFSLRNVTIMFKISNFFFKFR